LRISKGHQAKPAAQKSEGFAQGRPIQQRAASDDWRSKQLSGIVTVERRSSGIWYCRNGSVPYERRK